MSSLDKSITSNSSSSDEEAKLRRGPWTVEEDKLLIHYIACNGEGRWNLLAKRSGLKRNGKSCRLRWLNYLKPDVKRGNLTPQEQLLILELHFMWGNRWSKIAQHLPGRTDNEIKNYWRTRVQRQARHLKIDSNSPAFQQVIRSIWIPRLLQKIQNSAINTQNTNETLNNLDMNSGSESCPSVSSSESMNNNISQLTQVSEYSTDAIHDNSDSNYTVLKCCYNVDNISYGMETFHPEPGDFKDLIDDCHIGGDNNWIEDDLWKMDELWQFMQLQEGST